MLRQKNTLLPFGRRLLFALVLTDGGTGRIGDLAPSALRFYKFYLHSFSIMFYTNYTIKVGTLHSPAHIFVLFSIEIQSLIQHPPSYVALPRLNDLSPLKFIFFDRTTIEQSTNLKKAKNEKLHHSSLFIHQSSKILLLYSIFTSKNPVFTGFFVFFSE